MSSCSECASKGSCSSSTLIGGDGKCIDMNTVLAQQDKRIARARSHIRYKILVTSGKGGVGKSSITVNLAVALSQMGYKVGLLDVDIHGPSVPHLLGLASHIEAAPDGGFLPAPYTQNLSVVSMQVLLRDKDEPVLWRGTMKGKAIRDFISDVHWGDLDFLVIDSPPGTGDEPMTVLESIPEALCVVVTTPQEISLADVRKTVNFLAKAHANTLGIVENMSGLICPHCHQEIDLFKKGGGEKLACQHGLPFLGAIPLDPAAVVASDNGTPIVAIAEELPSKKALLDLAKNVARSAIDSLEVLAVTDQN
ncbi:MAG: Mrp/NBP35 family ATP-binding protein [Desulfovibrio sp.]|nr:Mrp/NBP35 family ATP-binding protein [Desulfovibrio sp.]